MADSAIAFILLPFPPIPIHRALELQSISDSRFAEIDKEVMACAYATHNHFDRLFDERVYENDPNTSA